MTTITLTTRIARPDDELAAYLARPSIAARLTPPWFPPNTLFDDRHIATHIDPDGQSACLLTEELRLPSTYSLPATRYSLLLPYRHATLRDDLEHTAPYGHVRHLRIAIAGARGLIGRALTTFLQTQDHEVTPLARDPATYAPDYLARALRNTDVVINLAGAPISTPPWTQPRRDQIWQSRVNTTRALIAALANLNPRPFAYLNASALGYYGTRGHDLLDETAPRGAGFLADVCAGWEHEAQAAAEQLGIRTTLLRFGYVLSPAGGLLAALLPLYQKNLAAPLGHGRQWTSWITIDDAIAAIYHAILSHACAGPVNISSPTPITNADFTAALARALHKKPLPALPRWALRLRYGIDFANETLLASQRLVPAKLQATNYTFRHPAIEDALAHLLP